MTPHTSARAWNFSMSHSLYIQAELEILQVPEPSTKLGRRIFPSPKAHMEGESSEFFQVPEPSEELGIFLNPRAYIKG